nr:unnamed protein product [Spirometra erinaceieuropaei]
MRDSSESPRRQADKAFAKATVSPSSPLLPVTCSSASIYEYLDYLNETVCLRLVTCRSQELSSMRLTLRPFRFGRVVYALCVVVGVGFLFYTFEAFRDLSPSTPDSGHVNPRILFPSAPIRGNNGSGPTRPKSVGESPEQQGRMQWVQLPDGNPIAHPVVGAPAVVPEVGIPVPKLPEFPVPDSDSDKDRPPGVVEPPRLSVEGRGTPLSVDEVRGGEPSDDLNKERRNKVKEMMKHAWTSYRKYAWGANELRPLSKTGHQPSVLGSAPMGATIVDAIDTLYIMGLDKEYEEAKKWIEESLKFTVNTQISVFEFTIRFVGGLLSIFSMTKEKIFLEKAEDLVNAMLPAFNTPLGIPRSLINLQTKYTMSFGGAPGGCSVLSEAGTLHMEFQYLSELTGKKQYSEMVHKIRSAIANIPRPDGLFHSYISFNSPSYCISHSTLGGLSDSFYEYLLKEWIRTGKNDTEARRLYDLALEGFEKSGMIRTSPSGATYLSTVRSGSLLSTMEHLACFAGGMFALGSQNNRSSVWFERGARVTETCYEAYTSTDTHLGPEKMTFSPNEFLSSGDKKYYLRPETVESYFYMWRLTKDDKYRKWAWELVEALEKQCRTDAGYSGISDVFLSGSPKDDVQQSFFLAETLKYLYLIFSEDSLLPLDRWVFNTEAHPLPIRGQVDLGPEVWPRLSA